MRLKHKPATRRTTPHVRGAGRRPTGGVRPADDRPFHSQIEKARHRVDRLQRLAGETHRRQDLLDQALHELSSALAELQVASEEVQRQNRELETATGRLELERRRYHVLFDRAPHGYLVTDSEGVIRHANRAGGDLIGTRPGALLGKPISLYLRAEHGRSAHLLIPRLHRGEVLAAEEVVVHPRVGPPVPALLSGASLEGPPGIPAELLFMLQDIRRRKSAEQALRQARDLLEADNRRRQELETSLRQLSARLLKAQEEERRRIARELHDSTAQKLTGLKLHLQSLARRSGPGLASDLAECQQLLADCMHELRSLTNLLHPPVLDEIGLVGALRWYASRLEQESGIRIRLSIRLRSARLPADLETALFRIIQECLTNLRRHSGSRSGEIRLRESADGVHLEVEDRGHGMSRSPGKRPAAESLGIGILGMQERAREAGGNLEVKSGLRGTTVRAYLPIRRRGASSASAGAQDTAPGAATTGPPAAAPSIQRD
jgi:PAS domain S-box-containing protein